MIYDLIISYCFYFTRKKMDFAPHKEYFGQLTLLLNVIK